jgi:serine/threonine protein kinase
MNPFIDSLRTNRLLDDTRLDELSSRSDAGDVSIISRYVQEQGWLTPYQIQELRAGRAGGLFVGGYRILDKLNEYPGGGGVSYKATHPALEHPVHLRVVQPSWLGPADSMPDYVARTQAACLVNSPHLTNVLDAGMNEETPFVVQEFVDGCDLFHLVNEMGALPIGLASEYIRQAAMALQAAHERGIIHGHVSPRSLLLTPVKRVTEEMGYVSIRPRSGATVKLADLGVNPKRPPLGEMTFGETDLLGPVEYLPPERLATAETAFTDDIYGLGASLYFLLTTKPPFNGASPAEAMLHLREQLLIPIEQLRSDLPAPLVQLIGQMLNGHPAQRPTLSEIIERILPYCEASAMPGAVPAAEPVPIASETDTKLGTNHSTPLPPSPTIEPLPEIHPLDEDDPFHQAAMGSSTSHIPQPRATKPAANKNHKAMIVMAVLLHLTALILLLAGLGILPNPLKSSNGTPTKNERTEK